MIRECVRLICIVNDNTKYYDDDDNKRKNNKTQYHKQLKTIIEWMKHLCSSVYVFISTYKWYVVLCIWWELVRCTLIKCDRYYIPIMCISIYMPNEWMSGASTLLLTQYLVITPKHKHRRQRVLWMETSWMKIMPVCLSKRVKKNMHIHTWRPRCMYG